MSRDGHLDAAARLREKLRRSHRSCSEWDTIWLMHKINAHDAVVDGRRWKSTASLMTFAVGVVAIERSSARPFEKVRQRKALCARLGLPEGC